jgi:hypothetical protein
VGRCLVASRYLVARAWVRPGVKGAALAMAAVVDIGTAGPLVGRVAELNILGVASGRAAAGSLQVVAICGEAGIGKSRLAREGLRAAGEKGFWTLESAAGRLHRDLSYAPIVEALRPLVADAALVEGLSDLARLFDGLRVPPLVALGDAGLERTRMFEAVRTLIERASARLPIAIFVDDLHWADPGTLALLHYLVRGLPHRRCLFLLTYRTDQASDDLYELVSALQRAETLTPVELTGLDAAGVERLAAAVLDGSAPPALLEMLNRRSGGVPLYVKAIVLRLIETGGLFRSGGRWVLGPRAAARLPAVVTTLLHEKIKALPPPARGVLDLLAVCGGVAEHVLLLDVADDIVEGVTELRSADVVVEDTRGGGLSYQVVHPVLAELAYNLVPVIVRRQLHAKLAGAVERHRPDDLRLLAAHIRAAGDQIDPRHALDVLTAAAHADLARLAGDEAAANAGAGLDLARGLGRDEAVDELAGAYAEACELSGRVQDAFAAWVDAAETETDPRTRARRLIRGAINAWDLGRFADAHGLLDAADRALADLLPCQERADVEEVRLRFAARAGDLVVLEEGVALLEGLWRVIGSSRSRAAMLFAHMGLAFQTGRYLDGLSIADELLTLVQDRDSPLMAEAMLRPLTAIHLSWGDLAKARAVVEEGVRLARQTSVPAIETFQNSLLGVADMLAGEWETALRRTFDARDLAQRVGFARGAIFALGTEAMLLVRLGRLDEAADRVSEGQRLFGKWSVADRHVFALIDLAEGMVALGRHELDHALEIAAGKAVHHPSIPPLALAFLGEVQAAVGDMNGAQETASSVQAGRPGARCAFSRRTRRLGLRAGERGPNRSAQRGPGTA